MKTIIEKRKDYLIIKPGLNNSSLANKELLKLVINELTESINKIIIINDLFRKEYDASILKDLPKGTTDPITEFLAGKKELINTEIIKQAKKVMKKGMNTSEIYNKILKPVITPLFIRTSVKQIPKGIEVSNYKINKSIIRIIKNNNKYFYTIEPAELKCDYETVNKITETLKELENKEFEINNFEEEINNVINKLNDKELINIAKRYSTGFGLIDIILNDELIQDVFIYSSDGSVQINHSTHGNCQTNIQLTKKDLEMIATKIRASSGRPFDDSFPVIDYELKDYGVRVCGVREPLTFNGVGYAFRKHKSSPWSLSDFVENGMLSSEVAGLLSFLVDGQCSILITGPRGSGKTSILSSLITEVPSNQRIITIEDTPELPLKKLIDAGYKIEHLRIKPHLKTRSTAYELSAEEALRTSLRLGESVLVIGEVRGEEAKALFEAMRIGAAGNVVLGTIHGSTVYDTFDRVVNDLGVPATSFKSTDIIISCANLRRGESTNSDRRVVSITEVKKDWINNPLKEKGFNELTIFDRRLKILRLSPRIKESSTLKRIAELKGMSVNECIKSILLRAKAKELIVKHKLPRTPETIIDYNNKITELLIKNKKNFIEELRNHLIDTKKNYKRAVEQ